MEVAVQLGGVHIAGAVVGAVALACDQYLGIVAVIVIFITRKYLKLCRCIVTASCGIIIVITAVQESFVVVHTLTDGYHNPIIRNQGTHPATAWSRILDFTFMQQCHMKLLSDT